MNEREVATKKADKMNATRVLDNWAAQKMEDVSYTGPKDYAENDQDKNPRIKRAKTNPNAEAGDTGLESIANSLEKALKNYAQPPAPADSVQNDPNTSLFGQALMMMAQSK